MEIATARNVIITQLKADTAITTVFPSASIKKGIGRRLKDSDTPRSIHVIQIGRGHTSNDAEELAEFAAGKLWVWALYIFHIAVIFTIDTDEDEEDAEDYGSLYDKLIRQNVMHTADLGGVVTETFMGRTFFRAHPTQEDCYFVIIEVACKVFEEADAR